MRIGDDQLYYMTETLSYGCHVEPSDSTTKDLEYIIRFSLSLFRRIFSINIALDNNLCDKLVKQNSN